VIRPAKRDAAHGGLLGDLHGSIHRGSGIEWTRSAETVPLFPRTEACDAFWTVGSFDPSGVDGFDETGEARQSMGIDSLEIVFDKDVSDRLGRMFAEPFADQDWKNLVTDFLGRKHQHEILPEIVLAE
jgi:hypothetical protein